MYSLATNTTIGDKGVSDQPQAKGFYCHPWVSGEPDGPKWSITSEQEREKGSSSGIHRHCHAFDSVAHEHLICVLKERGLDSHIIRLIKDSYEEVCTRIKVKEGTSPSK